MIQCKQTKIFVYVITYLKTGLSQNAYWFKHSGPSLTSVLYLSENSLFGRTEGHFQMKMIPSV